MGMRTTVDIPLYLHVWLKEEAERRSISKHALLLEIVQEMLANHLKSESPTTTDEKRKSKTRPSRRPAK
jgi:hypothetical protein